MSEALDRMRREVEELKRIVNAQRSGLPARLGVIVHSDKPTHIEAAVRAKLSVYGLSTVDEAEQAGCEVSVLCLPYCAGRQVDKTDPKDYDKLRTAGKGSDNEAQVCTDNASLLDTSLDTAPPAP